MKRFSGFCIVLTLTVILFPGILNAQDDLNVLQDQRFEKEIADFRSSIQKEKLDKNMDRELWIAFRVDTFTIQKTLDADLKLAAERYDATFAWSEAISAYNEMIGRYYNLLMDKMIEVDKQYLQQSQQKWLEYKQSEQVLNQIIGRKEYNNSGLINENYEYRRMLTINKRRAAELLGYLLRVNNR